MFDLLVAGEEVFAGIVQPHCHTPLSNRPVFSAFAGCNKQQCGLLADMGGMPDAFGHHHVARKGVHRNQLMAYEIAEISAVSCGYVLMVRVLPGLCQPAQGRSYSQNLSSKPRKLPLTLSRAFSLVFALRVFTGEVPASKNRQNNP